VNGSIQHGLFGKGGIPSIYDFELDPSKMADLILIMAVAYL
jgi:hypothetical protein